MIRINLLAGERTPQKKTRAAASQPGAVQLYMFLALFAGGALAACVFGYLLMSNRIAELDSNIQAAEQRKKQLEVIAKQVAEFERQEDLLKLKLQTIRELKAQQGGAVRLLDEISESLPEFVWLESMDQNGAALAFKGKSNSLNAVAEFIERLQDSSHPAAANGQPAVCEAAERLGCWFPSVELETSTEKDRIIDFSLTANFKTPPPETPPEEELAPAAQPAAGGQP